MIKLVGLGVMVVGFGLRVNPLLVVLVAAVSTGWASGFTFHETLAQLGSLFVQNRYIMMPVLLLLPLIGMLEHHGLRQRAETLIRSTRAATAGRVILLYSVVRQLAISVGVRIGEHASMVRPLVVPMAEAAALKQIRAETTGVALAKEGKDESLPLKLSHDIRAHAAAGENVGNFFGEDIFVAVGAVLLMHGFFEASGISVSLWAMALWGIPTAMVAFGLMVWRTALLDRRINCWQRGA